MNTRIICTRSIFTDDETATISRRLSDHLYTVDFYAKVHDVNRYRLRTNQHAAGKLGGTVLAIIAQTIRHDPQACFGFIAAAMLDETSDVNTKRFRL